MEVTELILARGPAPLRRCGHPVERWVGISAEHHREDGRLRTGQLRVSTPSRPVRAHHPTLGFALDLRLDPRGRQAPDRLRMFPSI